MRGAAAGPCGRRCAWRPGRSSCRRRSGSATGRPRRRSGCARRCRARRRGSSPGSSSLLC
ncbi:hypothetical protein EAO77_30615 [Streptomyces sp. t39]|nr:hypothetical protein EAO77_30615 [Streptomyces sp. t39]